MQCRTGKLCFFVVYVENYPPTFIRPDATTSSVICALWYVTLNIIQTEILLIQWKKVGSLFPSSCPLTETAQAAPTVISSISRVY